MKSDGTYYISAFKYTHYCTVEVKDKRVSFKENSISLQVESGSDWLSYIILSDYTYYIAEDPLKLHYYIDKNRFLDFSEEEWNLACMVDNVSQKYLKFIVGLYKLHTNQISTSELEQLVLDNIEDLL